MGVSLPLVGSGFSFQSFLFVPHKKGFPLQSLTQNNIKVGLLTFIYLESKSSFLKNKPAQGMQMKILFYKVKKIAVTARFGFRRMCPNANQMSILITHHY
jgi:hypothetical protein